MSIIDELDQALKTAMRERDQRTLDVVRAVKTELTKRRSEPGVTGDLNDAVTIEVIASFVKRSQKVREEYLALGERGAATAEKLEWENDFLSRWLPSKLNEAETIALIEAAIAETGASSPADSGRVIGSLMKSHKDDLDGSLVSRLVKERLTDA
ncbi:MAG: GatB/YqeY domain-containing protein [Acidimicrobiia bacterium]|nr:GatB/YqeY domain-containing protein [Acidimicrobiia bacterium]